MILGRAVRFYILGQGRDGILKPGDGLMCGSKLLTKFGAELISELISSLISSH